MIGAIRQDRERGHVAILPGQYSPVGGIPQQARNRIPWMLVIHDDPEGGPKSFVVFGGINGVNAMLDGCLGAVISGVTLDDYFRPITKPSPANHPVSAGMKRANRYNKAGSRQVRIARAARTAMRRGYF